MANHVVHVEVVGKDGQALEKFYSTIFDFGSCRANDVDDGLATGC